MKKFITIIVPVYKIREEYLKCCIESLLNQKRTDYNIILIDDGSPDNCGTICDLYAKDNECIEVIHQINQGVSVARNIGIERTKTEWMAFIDADDWVENNYISCIYQKIHTAAQNADIIMFDYIREYKDSVSVESLNIKEGYLDNLNLNACKVATYYKLIQNGISNPYSVVGLMTKVYRTDFIKKNQFLFIPEARKGQDRLFNVEVLNSTDRIYYFPQKLFHYRCWEESRTHRFDARIPELTKIELKLLYEILNKLEIFDVAEKYYTYRVCTRLYTIMRLYYFHPLNKFSKKEQINEVRKLIISEPYTTALKSIDIKLLSAQEKIFVICLKLGLIGMCRILVLMKSKLFVRHLAQ